MSLCSISRNLAFILLSKGRNLSTQSALSPVFTTARVLSRWYTVSVSRTQTVDHQIIFRNDFSSTTNSTLSDSISCWKCGVDVDLNKVLFCKHCEVVQKPKDKADYFEILGMERKFEIDTKTLTKNFRLLQMQLHPDRFSQKPDDEKEISATYSSLLNQAYKTLNSQLERGLYLLEIHEHPLKEGDEMVIDPEFLNQIMEINEEIFEVENQGDLQRLKETNNVVLQDLFRKIEEEFENRNFKAAREYLARVKYYSKIEERINDLQQKFEEQRL